MSEAAGTTFETVLIEEDGPVRIVTLNRPDTMNAFDDDMHHALVGALRDVGRDRTARAIVLTGAGRAFSAGGDIEQFELLADDLEVRRATLRIGRQLFEDLINVHLPVVVAVNGPAVGLGCTLVSACDMVFMSEKSYLSDPHVTVALVAGDGGQVTWPLNTGLLRAKEYLLTGDRVPPHVAVEIGMANRVVTPGSLMPESVAFAQRLAALPWQAVQDTKFVLNQHLRQSAVTALGFGFAAESQSHDTAEYRAVPATFRAQRK
ncbi:enoyl-CoA hydratase/isomerase family protein [Mycobacterium branderi]|uniref:Enoyl-CoA hydratase n=1 Tax=Mycobacterium branderi TaxID=43348 RepID=A0A7I7WD61_9MYCO|nr:enoyl-CoA hydratase/isomerase family protein [Mycobacterium branderi]MCV7231589.1 enoyl-CoA hydratase/isomerase family protein [Mycobacterium branderi]ORA40414.1 enoyl-CoA hydratase [Mycobacterium branderi]BBZ14927.1 enoyl-CoA hydratase [Mycobacterium branderi]